MESGPLRVQSTQLKNPKTLTLGFGVWLSLRTKLWGQGMITAKSQCGFQSMEMDTHLMARMDSWHMLLPLALVLGEILTLMMMSCGPWEKDKVR